MFVSKKLRTTGNAEDCNKTCFLLYVVVSAIKSTSMLGQQMQCLLINDKGIGKKLQNNVYYNLY